MPIKISTIKCEFCDFYFANGDSLNIMMNHESTCIHNPAFKACATCKNRRDSEFVVGFISCAIEDEVNLDTKADFWQGDHANNGNCKYWEAAE